MKIIINENQKLECLICGRDKFTKKTSHYCVGGFRKRRIKWAIKRPEGLFKELKNL